MSRAELELILAFGGTSLLCENLCVSVPLWLRGLLVCQFVSASNHRDTETQRFSQRRLTLLHLVPDIAKRLLRKPREISILSPPVERRWQTFDHAVFHQRPLQPRSRAKDEPI